MSKIRILPEQLANQIAAGEVVERPASVVKELLENSLDAGASHIEIEIEGGGTRLIRIIDNGEGMAEDDLLLSLERHGTSKIREAEDLQEINTLGFRGEAIPSIGSVSNMSITSRVADQPLGTKAVLKYGKLQKVHETGSSKGTIIEVQNLFGNTPARRKFLRTVRTELSHIEEAVKNYALASPDVTFILRINEKEILHLDGASPLDIRLKNIMHYRDELMEISGQNKHLAYSVHGFLAPPDKPISGAARLRFFVNGRAIKDRMLTHAVNEGLRGFLMKGKYPAGLIHVTLPPNEIDVNVHPAKHEIRFKNSRGVHQLVTSTVAQTMLEQQAKVRADLFGKTSPHESTPIPLETGFTSLTTAEPDTICKVEQPDEEEVVSPSEPFAKKQPPEPYDFPTEPPAEVFIEKTPEIGEDTAFIPPPPSEPEPKTQKSSISTSTGTSYSQPGKTEAPQRSSHGLKIIGQLQNLYILCQNEQGLLVIDQHAAHERLLFEELRKQYLENKVTRQALLFPETVELSILQTQLVEKNSDALEKMGFSIRDFGGNSFVISAIPALAGHSSASELFLDILEQFGSDKGNSGANRLDDILADIACKAAIKAGHDLQLIEMEALLNRMAKADLFSHCPHGRPVYKQFNQNDIKKWFYRT